MQNKNGRMLRYWLRCIEREESEMKTNASRLLFIAAVLLWLAGVIMAFTMPFLYAAMLWSGGLCCCVAALNFRKAEKKKNEENE